MLWVGCVVAGVVLLSAVFVALPIFLYMHKLPQAAEECSPSQ